MVRERGYPGSAIQVQRYVRTVRPAARAEAYLRLDPLAGEQAQVDWGNFGQVRVGSTTRLLSCFVLVLSWSRACYARFALDQALAQEQPRLLPLPERPFPCDLLRAVRSGKTPYIRFDGNDYSIPHTLVRRPLTLVAAEHQVRLLDGLTEIARHARRYERGQRVEDDAHLAGLVAAKRHAHDLRGRDRLRQVCPHADAFVEALAVRG